MSKINYICPSIDGYFAWFSYSPAYTHQQQQRGAFYIELKHEKKCHEALAQKSRQKCVHLNAERQKENDALNNLFLHAIKMQVNDGMTETKASQPSSQLQNIQEEAMNSGKTEIKYEKKIINVQM